MSTLEYFLAVAYFTLFGVSLIGLVKLDSYWNNQALLIEQWFDSPAEPVDQKIELLIDDLVSNLNSK